MKRWPLNNTYFWETAPFFRILLPFVVGIVCYDKASVNLSGATSLGISGITYLLFLALVFSKRKFTLNGGLTFALINVLMLFCGFSVSYFSDIKHDKKWFGKELSPHTSYLARINEAPVEKERSWKVPVTLIDKMDDGKISPVTGNAFLYLYKDYSSMLLHKGDSILMPGKWQPIKNAGNPFEFDYAQYCRRNNLYFQQSCSSHDIRLYGANDPAGMQFIEKTHDWCMERLDKYTREPKTKGLIQAMLLGDEVNLDEDLRQSYSETGIVHIIAISGGNVAIFFLVISFLLWWLKDKKHLWIKYAIALPMVWFYVIMAGAPPSAIRAAVMFSLLAFSIVFQKNNNSLNTLFSTAFLLLIAQPMWLFSAGFQLSFVAVLSLLLFYKPIYSWLSPPNKFARLIWGTVVASIAAEILAAPLVIYYFHTFPLLFIIANVAAYLFMSAALVLSIAIIILSFVPAIATAIGTCTVWLVTVFDSFVARLQEVNPTSFHFLMLSGVELVLTYAVISGVLLFLMKKQKPALFAGLAAAIILAAFFCNDEWLMLHQRRLAIYNTANANHIELIKGNRFFVLNTDTSAQKKIEYATKPAHISWRAWKRDSTPPQEIFDINGKTVLVLDSVISSDMPFPVDYLVVNYAANTDIAKLQKIFSPSAIIIGNNYSRQQQEKLAKTSKNEINLYSVIKNGAFVLN